MEDFTLPSTDWDVLVSGTGVKPSLLAAALSRAGKRVLQVDPNTYYGSAEAAFSLEELEAWASSPPTSFSYVSTERRAPTIPRPRSYTLTLAPHLVYWDSNLLELLRDVEMTTAFTWQAVGSWWVFLTDEEVARRPEGSSGSGSGRLSGALVDAGVKAVKAGGTVRRKAGAWNKGRKSRDLGKDLATLDLAEDPPLPAELHRTAEMPMLRKLSGILREVPCTFEDVAWSPDLQDRDRGYLGGFLRFVTKCSDPTDTKHHQLLLDYAETSLAEFLTTVYPLPPFTIASIHSLTLLPTPPEHTPLRAALSALTTHVSSIGRIPDIRSSAALTIAYGGSSELCQVWSRGAAVAGGLNVLSCGISSITPSSPKLTVSLTNSETITTTWILTTTPATTAATLLSKGIFIVSSPLLALFSKKNPDDRIAPNAAVLTFPADSLDGNEFPVYIIAHSSVTGECGKTESVLYTSTQHPQPAGYTFSEQAVQRVLSACGGGEVVFVCRYTQAFATTSSEGEGGVIPLSPMSGDLAFDSAVVEDCKRVYARIMGGSADGFLEMTEEMRKQYALLGEDE